MTRFSVRPNAIKKDAGIFGSCAANLQNQNKALKLVADDVMGLGEAYADVIKQLNSISDQFENEQKNMLAHQLTLFSIADAYQRADATVSAKMQDPYGGNADPSDMSIKKLVIRAALLRMRLRMATHKFLSRKIVGYVPPHYEMNVLNSDDLLNNKELWNLIKAIANGESVDPNALVPLLANNDAVVSLYYLLSLSNTELAKKVPLLASYFSAYENNMTYEEMTANYLDNLKSINPSIYTPGQFIENQNQWGNVKYGKDTDYEYVSEFANTSNMQASGCGIIAVANALTNKGEVLENSDMALLINSFERNGMVMNGVMGTSPLAMYEYMVAQGYQADYITSTEPGIINDFARGYDTFIVTVYNDQNDVTAGLHHVCITVGEDGKYYAHNVYDPATGTYGMGGPYENLNEAIENISPDDPQPIMITRVGDKVEE